jgi:hypothetical protein
VAHKKKPKRTTADDLREATALDAALRDIVEKGLEQARREGALLILRLPWKLVKRLSELETRLGDLHERN